VDLQLSCQPGSGTRISMGKRGATAIFTSASRLKTLIFPRSRSEAREVAANWASQELDGRNILYGFSLYSHEALSMEMARGYRQQVATSARYGPTLPPCGLNEIEEGS
jgi:hypothetical protein